MHVFRLTCNATNSSTIITTSSSYLEPALLGRGGGGRLSSGLAYGFRAAGLRSYEQKKRWGGINKILNLKGDIGDRCL